MKTFSKKDIVDRLKQALKAENNSDLANILGVNKSTISNWINRDSIDYDLVFSFCEHINLDWLLTGRGDMHKSKCPPCNTPGEIISDSNDKNTEFIAHEQINQIHFPKSVERLSPIETVALYDIEAAANLKSLYDNRHENIIGQIAIPDIPKCDGAVYVRGDSMYPRLKSGDIIVFKFVPNELSSIFYGEMYLISMDLDGDDYLTIKYIKRSEKGDNWVKLVSHNPEHDPKDIPLSAIRALALVKVSISMNTMN